MKFPAVFAVVVSALAVAGYVFYAALQTDPGVESVEAQQPQNAPDARPAPAETLPEFVLANLSGEQQSIRSWPERSLVINFWATWCAPCLREIPLLKAFQDEHRDNDVTVVGIAVDQPDPVRAFAEDMTFNYPVLVGQAGGIQAAASFGVDFFALPFTVFVDSNRNVLGVHTGELHAEDLDNLATVFEALDSGRIDLAEARDRVAGRM